MSTMWSPLKLQMLLHFMCVAEACPNVNAPAQQQVVHELLDAKLIVPADWGYRTTARGAALGDSALAAVTGLAEYTLL